MVINCFCVDKERRHKLKFSSQRAHKKIFEIRIED